jgi:hypothetical protein
VYRKLQNTFPWYLLLRYGVRNGSCRHVIIWRRPFVTFWDPIVALWARIVHPKSWRALTDTMVGTYTIESSSTFIFYLSLTIVNKYLHPFVTQARHGLHDVESKKFAPSIRMENSWKSMFRPMTTRLTGPTLQTNCKVPLTDILLTLSFFFGNVTFSEFSGMSSEVFTMKQQRFQLVQQCVQCLHQVP